MVMYRRRIRGRFFIFIALLLVILGAVGWGAKVVIDQKAVASNAKEFDDFLKTDDFSQARAFYDSVDKVVKGAVREQSLEKMNESIRQRVSSFSLLALQGNTLPGDHPAIKGLPRFSKESLAFLQEEVSRAYEQYAQGKLEYARINAYFDNIRLLGFADDLVNNYAQQALGIYNAQEGLRDAEENISSGNYYEAYKFYASVDPASNQYEKAQSQMERYRADALANVLNIAAKQAEGQRYEEAMQTLDEAAPLFPDEAALTAKAAEYKQANEVAKNDLVPYSGPIEHVFTHTLIAFPEIANSSPAMQQALYRDCITPYELKKILPQLYAKGYILIDINLLYTETTDENGNTVPKIGQLMLPRGKKPLILSIDDVVYDANKMGMGMVDKLIVGEDGRVLSYTKMKDGTEVISDDNEVFPIVDKFVEEHPDFSFNGAKGTLCMTGFQGIFGYRTQRDAPAGTDIEKEKAEALKVAKALKDSGWNFASHSYKHGKMKSKMSLESVQDDADKWEREVASLLGETKIFVYPYGDSLHPGDADNAKLKVLYDKGFRLFCGVGGSQPYIRVEKDKKSIFMDRRPFDGYSLTHRQESYKDLIDCNASIDPQRPLDVTRDNTYY